MQSSPQTPIQVVGIGLDGSAGLTETVRQIIDQATLLIGSDRHLSYFPTHPADRLPLTDLPSTLRQLRSYLPPPPFGKGESAQSNEGEPLPPPRPASLPTPLIVILTSGDPLFFGLGRLLLEEFPPEWITFHPHLSSVQLAFSRIKVSWQDARVISAHGRSLDALIQALQQGSEKIAVLTDGINSPQAIARLVMALELPSQYRIWVCENLGSPTEQIRLFVPEALGDQTIPAFAPLNVVVLLRSRDQAAGVDLARLPTFGIPDACFLSFADRPGLMTKREIRLLILGELALQAGQTIWDIGAGTGSVSVEIARLLPDAQVYAIERTAAGAALIQQNCQRFQVNNVITVCGQAPVALQNLPAPDRIFIGGSGGQLTEILEICSQRGQAESRVVLALATLENLTTVLSWLEQQRDRWQYHLLQAQLARSIPVGPLTRFDPLNPVTLITLWRMEPPQHPRNA